MNSLSVTNANWYIVYTFARCEKKVYSELIKRGLDAYLPVQTVTRLWSDRKKIVEIPLIQNYIFVKCNNNDFTHVRRIKGVSTFLSDLKRQPISIKEDIIKTLRYMIENTEIPIEFTGENLHAGTRVEVIKGKLKGLTGELVEKNGDYQFMVRLDRFGCILTKVATSCLRELN